MCLSSNWCPESVPGWDYSRLEILGIDSACWDLFVLPNERNRILLPTQRTSTYKTKLSLRGFLYVGGFLLNNSQSRFPAVVTRHTIGHIFSRVYQRSILVIGHTPPVFPRFSTLPHSPPATFSRPHSWPLFSRTYHRLPHWLHVSSLIGLQIRPQSLLGI